MIPRQKTVVHVGPLRRAADVLAECARGNYNNAAAAYTRLAVAYPREIEVEGQLHRYAAALKNPTSLSSVQLNELCAELHSLARLYEE